MSPPPAWVRRIPLASPGSLPRGVASAQAAPGGKRAHRRPFARIARREPPLRSCRRTPRVVWHVGLGGLRRSIGPPAAATAIRPLLQAIARPERALLDGGDCVVRPGIRQREPKAPAKPSAARRDGDHPDLVAEAC